jgi:hypothetical protein
MAVRTLIGLRYLFDRLSQPRTRAEEARDVRMRLAEQDGPDRASPEEARIALELRRLREGLCELFEDARACGRCVPPPYGAFRGRSGRALARGAVGWRSRPRVRLVLLGQTAARSHDGSNTQWPGGHCCSGPTRNLFTDEELAALRLSGTTPGGLRLPRGAHSGCAFRSPLGCSLDAAHRPSLCVRYTCRDLEAELGRGSSRSAILALQRQVAAAFDRFVKARQTRLEHQELAELLAAASDRT